MVSVIIPVYNAAPYLKACLESVTVQTYADLEILLIDDGSADASASICRSYARQDRRVSLISQENAGVSAARNRGLSLAKGEYLLFVDADDILPAFAVEMLLKQRQNADLVIGSYEAFRGWYSRKICRKEGLWTRQQCREAIDDFDSMLSTVWGKLYRRQVILDHQITFDEKLPYCEDHVFNLAFCRQMDCAAVTQAVCYRYRLGGPASSLTFHPNMAACQGALLQAYQTFFDGQVPEVFWNRKWEAQLRSSILHEAVHHPYLQALARTEAVCAVYALEGPVDSGKLLRGVYRENWPAIVLKKIKIALWRRFRKRI